MQIKTPNIRKGYLFQARSTTQISTTQKYANNTLIHQLGLSTVKIQRERKAKGLCRFMWQNTLTLLPIMEFQYF